MPDAAGHFGIFGGCFAAETLMEAIEDLRDAYYQLKDNAAFQAEYNQDLKHYVGRPSPL